MHGHTYHTATLLLDGGVIVIGGYDENNADSADIERLDPTTKTWTAGWTCTVAGVTDERHG